MKFGTIQSCYKRKQICFSISCLLLVSMMAVNFPFMDIVKLFSTKDYVLLCLSDFAGSLPSAKAGVPSELTLSLSREGKEILILKSTNDTRQQLLSCEALFGKGYVGIEKAGINQAKTDWQNMLFQKAGTNQSETDWQSWQSMFLHEVQIKKAGEKSFGSPVDSGSILNATVYELTIPEEASKRILPRMAESAGDSELKCFADTVAKKLNSDVVMDLYIDSGNKIIGACVTFNHDENAVYAEFLSNDLDHPLNHLTLTCITEDKKGKKSTLYICSQGDHDFADGAFSDETNLKFYDGAILSATATASTSIQDEGHEGNVEGSFDAKIYGLNFRLSSAGSYKKENKSTFLMNCRITSQRETLTISLNYAENKKPPVRQVSFRSLGSVLQDNSFQDRLKNFLIGNNIAS